LKVLLAIVLASLMVVPGAYVGGHMDPHHSYAYFISDVPEIYLKDSNGSLNLSFVQIALYQNGSYYSAGLRNVRWEHPVKGSINYSYSGEVNFFPVENFRARLLMSRLLGTNSASAQTAPFFRGYHGGVHSRANVTIMVNGLARTHIFGLNETNGSRYGAFRVSFVITSSSIHGGGIIGLFQILGSNGKFGYFNHGNEQMVKNGSETGLVLSSGKDYASYWWTNNYTVNGQNKTLSVLHTYAGPFSLLVFRYNFTNGITNLTQDPYLASPEFNFLNSPISAKVIRESELFLEAHIKILLEGAGTGALLLGVAYGSYAVGKRSLKKRY
jgi:hypothetical protein